MILEKMMTFNRAMATMLTVYFMMINIMNVWVDFPIQYVRRANSFRYIQTSSTERVSDVLKPVGITEVLQSIPIKSEIQEDIVTEVETIAYDFENVGYINASALNVRDGASMSSKKISILSWNSEVHYSKYDDNWDIIQLNNGEYGYINHNYVSDTQFTTNYYSVSSDNRKSFMSYKTITAKRSTQYEIQSNAVTDNNGLRLYSGRYCVAVGTGYDAEVGTYIDVVLDDGTIIPCVVGDIKANCDTDSSNTQGKDGSIVEFIVDMKAIPEEVSSSGDVSSIEEFSAKVTGIHVYDL